MNQDKDLVRLNIKLETKDECIRILTEALKLVIRQRDLAINRENWDQVEKGMQTERMNEEIQRILRSIKA